jgi:hypothetical protein
VLYGSNPYRKDNPCRAISNATETRKVPAAPFLLSLPLGHSWDHPVAGGSGIVAGIIGWTRNACGICAAWLTGLPRRTGARLHVMNDAEARWWRWQVTECRGGLARGYRDARFEMLAQDPALRRVADLVAPDTTPPDSQGPSGG